MHKRPIVLILVIVAVMIAIAGVFSMMQADRQNVEEEPDAGMIAPLTTETGVG